jgi:hypothetical protein
MSTSGTRVAEEGGSPGSTFAFGGRLVEEKMLRWPNGVETCDLPRYGLEALLLLVPAAATQRQQEAREVLHVCMIIIGPQTEKWLCQRSIRLREARVDVFVPGTKSSSTWGSVCSSPSLSISILKYSLSIGARLTKMAMMYYIRVAIQGRPAVGEQGFPCGGTGIIRVGVPG